MRPAPQTERAPEVGAGPAPTPSLRVALLLLHAGFVLTGIVTTLLGPLLPILGRRWALDDWQAGLLFTLQFAGSLVGVAVSSAAMTRLGLRATLATGLLVMAVGVVPLAVSAAPLGFAGVFCYGIGLGLTIPTTNLTVAAWQPSRRAPALNVLNLAWGLGAVSAARIVAWLYGIRQITLFPVALAAALGLIALALSRLRLPPGGRVSPSGRPASSGSDRWTAKVLLFGGMLFVYVGTETAIAGWLAVYAERLAILTPTAATATPSLFWAALLAGRGAAPLVLRRVSETQLVPGSLLLACGGVALLLVAESPPTLTAGAVLGGLGLAAIFPTTMALFAGTFDDAAARLAMPVFAMASLGGASQPPLVGLLSSYSGSLRIGLLVPLLGCIAMLALQGAITRRARPITASALPSTTPGC